MSFNKFHACPESRECAGSHIRCRLASMAADAAQGLPHILNRRGTYTTGRKESHATQAAHPSATIAHSHAGAPRSADMLSTAQALCGIQETHLWPQIQLIPADGQTPWKLIEFSILC